MFFFTACAQETGVSSSSTHPPPVPPPIMSLPMLLCTIFLLTLYSALSIICLYAHRCCTRGKKKFYKHSKSVLPLSSDCFY